MKFYLAPLEGITGYIYRNAYESYFHNVDKYFTPFISPNPKKPIRTREMKDISPANNQGKYVVPQILTNHASDFIETAKALQEFGYEEVNLNLGCPSGTVVARRKGSGFLLERELLNEFLEEIFSKSPISISVKTRLGKNEPEEFYKLIEIFNQYPMKELIIHPRVQKEQYKGFPHMDIFKDALAASTNPVCYNGNIFTKKDYDNFVKEFPAVDKIMIGRGILGNPFLIDEIKDDIPLDKALLKEFHDRLYHDYQETLFGDRPLLYKMKELWYYMHFLFSENEKYYKKIRKTDRLSEYDTIVSALFREQELVKGSGFFFS